MNNSRSEPPKPPQTPQKPRRNTLPPTPDTGASRRGTHKEEPHEHTKAAKADEDSSFDWSSSNDEALLEAEQQVLKERPQFETPKKAARTQSTASPGKRAFGQMAEQSGLAEDTWPLSDDVFATPSTSHKSGGTGLLSPNYTPARGRAQPMQPEAAPSPLATAALAILTNAHLDSQTKTELVDLLNKHDLRTQGVIKGREITRLAVQAKEKRIAELQARIEALEAERETNRTVINHLKQDIVNSPKKGRGHRNIPARRSEV